MATWFTRRHVSAQPNPTDTSPTMPVTNDAPLLGWCLVTFLNDVLEPSENGRITCIELFNHYRLWCADQRLVPINEGDFIEQLGKVAPQVDIPIKQSGGNITLFGARIIPCG